MSRKLLSSLIFLTLSAVIIPFHHPVATVDAAQWTSVNIPAEGTIGGGGTWTLANGSDIRYLTIASDGTLYCYANPSGTTYTLFKSVENGHSWTTTGKVTDVIIDIAILTQDSTNIYYDTVSGIYKSVDTGNTFFRISPDPGGAGSGNILITSVDVVQMDKTNIIAVSTIDTDAAQYGGVYLLDERKIVSNWVNTGIGN